MKSTKKETKSSGEFPKEFDVLRNSALFNIANRGITPLQPFSNNNGSHQFNPFFSAYQSQVNPWAFNPSQAAPSPVFGVQPSSPSFYPY